MALHPCKIECVSK